MKLKRTLLVALAIIVGGLIGFSASVATHENAWSLGFSLPLALMWGDYMARWIGRLEMLTSLTQELEDAKQRLVEELTHGK